MACHVKLKAIQQILSNVSFQVLKRDLMKAISRKRPHLVSKFILFMDNAPVHKSGVTTATLEDLSIEAIFTAPYSPDTNPLDFYYYGDLKRKLSQQPVKGKDHLVQNVNMVTQEMAQNGFKKVYENWLKRHHKVVENNGNYFNG